MPNSSACAKLGFSTRLDRDRRRFPRRELAKEPPVVGRGAVAVPSAEAMLAAMIDRGPGSSCGFPLRVLRAWCESPLPPQIRDDERLMEAAREHQRRIRTLLPLVAGYRRIVVRVFRQGRITSSFAHRRLLDELGPVLANAVLSDTARRWTKKHGICPRCSTTNVLGDE
jgi:hypothetical protein